MARLRSVRLPGVDHVWLACWIFKSRDTTLTIDFALEHRRQRSASSKSVQIRQSALLIDSRCCPLQRRILHSCTPQIESRLHHERSSRLTSKASRSKASENTESSVGTVLHPSARSWPFAMVPYWASWVIPPISRMAYGRHGYLIVSMLDMLVDVFGRGPFYLWALSGRPNHRVTPRRIKPPYERDPCLQAYPIPPAFSWNLSAHGALCSAYRVAVEPSKPSAARRALKDAPQRSITMVTDTQLCLWLFIDTRHVVINYTVLAFQPLREPWSRTPKAESEGFVNGSTDKSMETPPWSSRKHHYHRHFVAGLFNDETARIRMLANLNQGIKLPPLGLAKRPGHRTVTSVRRSETQLTGVARRKAPVNVIRPSALGRTEQTIDVTLPDKGVFRIIARSAHSSTSSSFVTRTCHNL